MGKLLQRLEDAAKSGVYRTSRIDPLADSLRGNGLDFERIALHGIRDKSALMDALSRSLRLPAWFGANWDALEDCLSDLSWRAAAGHVFVFEGLDSLPQDDAGVLFGVLESAAQFWRGQDKPFFAVFVDPGRKLALPDLFIGA